MIALFSALNQEVDGLKKMMFVSGTSSYKECRITEGKCGSKENLLVLTGVGKENARQAIEIVLEKYAVSAIISTGFGGALNEKTKVGDIVMCSGLLCGEYSVPGQNIKEKLIPDPRLTSALKNTIKDMGLSFMIGTGLTVQEVAEIPETKLALGRQFGADMVDMESYWIGKIAADKGLPFVEVRSIFDTVGDDLSWLSQIMPGGKVNSAAAVSAVILHPGRIKKLAYFAGNAKKAEHNLAVFLNKLVQEIG